MATTETVKKALAFLGQVKPGTDLGTISMEAYQAVLAPIPDDVLEKVAIIFARQSGSFLPSAGDLYDAALDLVDDSPDVGEAWALVLRKARGGNPDLPERAARAAAMMGGTAGWLAKDEDYKRREFAKAYEAAGREWRERMALPGAEMKMLADAEK